MHASMCKHGGDSFAGDVVGTASLGMWDVVGTASLGMWDVVGTASLGVWWGQLHWGCGGGSFTGDVVGTASLHGLSSSNL